MVKGVEDLNAGFLALVFCASMGLITNLSELSATLVLSGIGLTAGLLPVIMPPLLVSLVFPSTL